MSATTKTRSRRTMHEAKIDRASEELARAIAAMGTDQPTLLRLLIDVGLDQLARCDYTPPGSARLRHATARLKAVTDADDVSRRMANHDRQCRAFKDSMRRLWDQRQTEGRDHA